MFQTDQSWEERENIGFLRSLLEQPGLRRYKFFEISSDPPLLHVEVLYHGEAEECGLWVRYVCCNASAALTILTQETVSRAKAYAQLRDTSDQYSMKAVHEIFETGKAETALLHFRCADGKTYCDGIQKPSLTTARRRRTLWADSAAS